MANAKESSKGGGHNRLTIQIVVAIVIAVVMALVFPHFAMLFDVGGEIFLRLLQMIVVPLVMASVMSGILGLGDVRKLGKPGGAAILYYLTTTLLAVVVGLIVVNVIRPGRNLTKETVQQGQDRGDEQVSRAQEAEGKKGMPITWNSGTVSQRQQSGTSDEIEVDGQHLVISVKQVGNAETPASVEIEWSESAKPEDDKQFQELDQKFSAGMAEGSYKKIFDIPHDAQTLRLVYESQSGGESSTVSAEITPGPPSIGEVFESLLLMLVTKNLLHSMVEMDLLPVIVFSILFAGLLTTMGKRSQVISDLVHSINDALMSFIMLLMKFAPIGIFCLVTARFGQAQAEGDLLEFLQTLAYYMASVLLGLSIHAFVTLPLILWIFTRRNPYKFMLQMSQALLTAFSTASSTATLPITMECGENEANISKESTEFVLPLGATINMDGTALYEAAAAIFIAEAYALVDPTFSLTFVDQLTIAVTATLAAIGAAGIPEAGLITMLIVLNAVGLPLELIGLIIPVDWLLDRFRTAVNVLGDSAGAAIVEKTFPAD